MNRSLWFYLIVSINSWSNCCCFVLRWCRNGQQAMRREPRLKTLFCMDTTVSAFSSKLLLISLEIDSVLSAHCMNVLCHSLMTQSRDPLSAGNPTWGLTHSCSRLSELASWLGDSHWLTLLKMLAQCRPLCLCSNFLCMSYLLSRLNRGYHRKVVSVSCTSWLMWSPQ